MTEGIDIITAMFTDWNAHDLEAVYEHLAEDYRGTPRSTKAAARSARKCRSRAPHPRRS